MIIVCEKCGSNYYVDQRLLTSYYKRKVRCVNCGHVWEWKNDEVRQDMPIEPPAFANDMFAPPPYQPTPIRWPFYTLAFFVGLMAVLILGHRYVRQYIPATRFFYDVILPRATLNHDFMLHDLRVEYVQKSKESSGSELKITGAIAYKPQEHIARTPPMVEVTFYERGGCGSKSFINQIFERFNLHPDLCPTDTWMIQPYDQLMMPGEHVPFKFSSVYKGTKKPEMMDARVLGS